MRAEEVAGKKNAVFGQISAHGFGPVNPRGVNKRQRFVAQRQRFAVGNRLNALFGNMQMRHHQVLRHRRTEQLGVRIFFQHPRNAAGVVLLDVLHNHIIQTLHMRQLPLEHIQQQRVHRVNQRRLFRAFNKICIIAGAIGQRNQRIKQPPVPVNSAEPMDPIAHFSWFHSQFPFLP